MATFTHATTTNPPSGTPSALPGIFPSKLRDVDRSGKEALSRGAEANSDKGAVVATQQGSSLNQRIDEAFRFIRVNTLLTKTTFKKILGTIPDQTSDFENNFAMARCKFGLASLIQGSEQKLD